MVEWDPYTFALTENRRRGQFKDLQEGVTLHEEVDEVTGLSRHVVADSPDEKRQPAIVVKGKGSKRYLMPSRAHLMVQDGDTVFPGDVAGQDPARNTKTKDITGGLPRVVELFEARKPHETAVISRNRWHGQVSAKSPRASANSMCRPITARKKNTPFPRRSHQRAGRRARQGGRTAHGRPAQPARFLAVLGEKELQSYLVNEIQEVYRLQGVNISDKHYRSDCPPDDALGEGRGRRRHHIPAGAATGQVPLPRRERARDQGRGKPATGRPLLLASRRLRSPPTRSSSAASFRRPRACSPKLPSRERSITCADSRKTSSSAASSLPEPAWSTTATSALAGNGRGGGQGTGGSLGGLRRGRARARDDAPRGRNRGTGSE